MHQGTKVGDWVPARNKKKKISSIQKHQTDVESELKLDKI
jgi:hypothetical protein